MSWLLENDLIYFLYFWLQWAHVFIQIEPKQISILIEADVSSYIQEDILTWIFFYK